MSWVTLAKRAKGLLFSLAIICCCGCGSKDWSYYEAYYRTAPKTIMIAPIHNLSTDAEAGNLFMATIIKPLILRGYNPFPIEATADILANEGITDGQEARKMQPELIHQYFGADGILYVTVEAWDSSYYVVAGNVTVTILYEFIHARTGTVIWRYRANEVIQSGGRISGDNALVGLIAMAVDAAVTVAFSDYVDMAREANYKSLNLLPPGTYHPEYENIQRQIQEWRAQQNSSE